MKKRHETKAANDAQIGARKMHFLPWEALRRDRRFV